MPHDPANFWPTLRFTPPAGADSEQTGRLTQAAVAKRLDGPRAVFIYSGFLLEQKTEIEEAFARAGLPARGFAQLGE